MGYGEGEYGLGEYGLEEDDGPVDPLPGESVLIYIFEPPTHEEPIRTAVEPLLHYRLTYAKSVVRIDGLFTQVRIPAVELLEEAGEQGVDWFRGGYVYEVSEEIRDELVNAGFPVREIEVVTPAPGEDPDDPDNPPPPDDLLGFGQGGFGSGNYGE